MSKPIRPSEVSGRLNNSIPATVIDAFNELIVKNFTGSCAIIFQKDAIALIKKKGINEGELFENRWLDVEDVFRKSGWEVLYDKPGYNESYEPTFQFTARRNA